jgi:hypothetical protein
MKQSSGTIDTGAFGAHASTSQNPSVLPKAVCGKPPRSRRSTNDKGDRKCFYCGKSGHLKKNCWKLKADKGNGAVMANSNMSTAPSDSDRGTAFVVMGDSRYVDTWVCDSGASHHMTSNKQYFTTYNRFLTPVNVSLANKSQICAYGAGRINVLVLTHGKWCHGYLENVWYVPDIGRHLFSVRSATEHGTVNSRFYEVSGTGKLALRKIEFRKFKSFS